MMRRILLSILLVLASCQAEISGRLPKFDGVGFGTGEKFDIVWSGAVPRRVSISPEEPLRTQGKTLDLESVRKVALGFITDNSEFLRSQGIHLRVDGVSAEGIHHHAYFTQTLNNLPVFDAGIDVFFTDDLQLELVHNQLVPALSVSGLGGEISQQEAAEQALSTVPAGATVLFAPSPVLGYEVEDGVARLSYRVRVTTEDPDLDQLVILDALSGAILEVRDLRMDVAARGNAFPFSNRFYSAPAQVEFEVDNSGFLRSESIDVQVGEGARASSSQQNFAFSASDPRFGEVNTFFHMQGLVSFLGKNGIAVIGERFPIRVRGVPEVNAFYDPSRRRIVLGSNQGIDLSLDGDVVVHEFGHAILDRLRPGLIGSGLEAGAIHESFGDTLAAYYFENPDLTEGFALDVVEKLGLPFYEQICPGFDFSPARPRCRSAENNLTTRDMIGEVHFDGMILSGALWEIFEEMRSLEGDVVGRDRAIRTLVRAASFLPSTNARFTDFLAAMVEADRVLNAGKYRTAIVGAFANHGITRPDILQCTSARDCDGGDRCNAGFCDGGNPQPQACANTVECNGPGLVCESGMCIPEDGGAFFFQVSATDLPLAIPDNNPTGAASKVEVPIDVTVNRLQVTVKISHSFTGDLTLSLETPGGEVILLQDREGGSADNINRIFEIVGFEGRTGQGIWTLRVLDRAAQDVGTLEEFTLTFN